MRQWWTEKQEDKRRRRTWNRQRWRGLRKKKKTHTQRRKWREEESRRKTLESWLCSISFPRSWPTLSLSPPPPPPHPPRSGFCSIHSSFPLVHSQLRHPALHCCARPHPPPTSPGSGATALRMQSEAFGLFVTLRDGLKDKKKQNTHTPTRRHEFTRWRVIYLSSSPVKTPLTEVARFIKARWKIEEKLKDFFFHLCILSI